MMVPAVLAKILKICVKPCGALCHISRYVLKPCNSLLHFTALCSCIAQVAPPYYLSDPLEACQICRHLASKAQHGPRFQMGTVVCAEVCVGAQCRDNAGSPQHAGAGPQGRQQGLWHAQASG